MKTTKEKIAVMQAYEDGKVIEMRRYGLCSWEEVHNPGWNWNACDYRVKPEPKPPTYRPYESFKEMVEDFDKRFPHGNRPKYSLPLISLKSKETNNCELIFNFAEEEWWFEFRYKNYEYLDGTPFGKLVEE